MNLHQLIDRFRKDAFDLVAPYFWSDDELTHYANQAETEACRRALLIVDSTSPVSRVDIVAGDEGVTLDPAVVYVRRAKLASRGRTLIFKCARAMDEEFPGWENAVPSIPVVAIPDFQTGYLRFWPPSVAADTLEATVIRTPLREMENEEDFPEISPRYHVHLLKWMKHLAYSKPDADTYDRDRGQLFAEQFTAEFGPPRAALDEHWAAEQYYDIGAY
jgi:hypothetical protein